MVRLVSYYRLGDVTCGYLCRYRGADHNWKIMHLVPGSRVFSAELFGLGSIVSYYYCSLVCEDLYLHENTRRKRTVSKTWLGREKHSRNGLINYVKLQLM